MINRGTILAASLALLAGSLVTAVAQQHTQPAAENSVPSSPAESSAPSAASRDLLVHDAPAELLAGEKLFRANCGRCHVAPPKFPPRVMATILRHMRVRALITDQDGRLILRYMTQ